MHSLLRWNRFFQHGWFLITFKPKSIFTLFLEGGKKDKLNNVCCFSLCLHHFLAIYHKPNQMTCRASSGAEHRAVGQWLTIQPPLEKRCSSVFNSPGSKPWQMKDIKEKSLLVAFLNKGVRKVLKCYCMVLPTSRKYISVSTDNKLNTVSKLFYHRYFKVQDSLTSWGRGFLALREICKYTQEH